MPAPRRDPASRIADTLASPILNALIGLAGIVIPVIAWVSARASVRNGLLIAETAIVIIIVMTANHLWLRKAFITLRRATNLKAMDDAHITTWSAPSWNGS
ncbi:hypothetical protein ABT174_33725 [Streptomyces sparsogenes]|uniref:hypothetical protein n=1 Tax=Streptomyces sparsogenes TaxID=67365 RepID=UPI0033337A62